MFVNDVLGNTESGILNIHLHQHFAAALMVTTILLNTPVHIRRIFYFAVLVKLQPRVDTADVLTADESDAANSRAHSKMLPVSAGYLCGTQGTGEYRNLHFNPCVPAVLGFCAHRGESGGVRVADNSFRHAPGTHGVPLDVEM